MSVIRANALDLPLADESVDLIVTSPPYFALRSYQDGGEHFEGQLGSEANPQEFLEALWAATKEMVRVLKPTGSIFVNLGDKYQQAPNREGPMKMAREKAGEFDGRARRPGTQFVQPKSLMGLPWRYAIGCMDETLPYYRERFLESLLMEVAEGIVDPVDIPGRLEEYDAKAKPGLGLVLRAEIIWSKPNGLPESVADRVRRSHEQWFHFTKAGKYFAAIDEIREPHLRPEAADGSRTFGGKKDASGGRVGSAERRYGMNTYDDLNPLGKLPGSVVAIDTDDLPLEIPPEVLATLTHKDDSATVWSVPTEPLKVPPHLEVEHFAAFPTEWPRRLILGWSPPGTCVECGEGRRPVVDKSDDPSYGGPVKRGRVGRIDLADEGRRGAFGTLGDTQITRQVATIIGYACACTPYQDHPGSGRSSPTATQNGKQGDRPVDIGATHEKVGPWREYHFEGWEAPATRPAVVLDPFGGTGTTAMVANALGRMSRRGSRCSNATRRYSRGFIEERCRCTRPST